MILWLRTHVFGHLWLKIVSLLIALALYWAVAHDQPAEIALSVPIEFYNTPEHLEISSERIQRAELRVQGPARILREMTNADVDAIIDLMGTKVGEHTFDLTPKQIRHLPHNVHIVQVVPSQIRLELDRSATKLVDVTPRVIGTFAAGYRLGEPQVARPRSPSSARNRASRTSIPPSPIRSTPPVLSAAAHSPRKLMSATRSSRSKIQNRSM